MTAPSSESSKFEIDVLQAPVSVVVRQVLERNSEVASATEQIIAVARLDDASVFTVTREESDSGVRYNVYEKSSANDRLPEELRPQKYVPNVHGTSSLTAFDRLGELSEEGVKTAFGAIRASIENHLERNQAQA